MDIFDSEIVGNRSFFVSKPWTYDEIQSRLNGPTVNVIIQKILGNRMDDFEITNLHERFEERRRKQYQSKADTIECSVDVQMIAYPMSFLKPVPIHGQSTQASENSLVMADDNLNTLALKLVRLVLPSNSRQLHSEMTHASGMSGRVRNMLDIHDIMDLRRAKHMPPVDLKKLRVLFLAHLAYQKQDEIDSVSLSYLDDQESFKKAFDSYIRGDSSERGGRIPDKVVRYIVDDTMVLMNGMFPEYKETGELKLKKQDQDFIKLAKGTHPKKTPAKSMRSDKHYSFQHPHLAVELLATSYPQEFDSFLKDDPEFKQRMANNWNLRPRHGGLDDAIMENAVYPPGKEPRTR